MTSFAVPAPRAATGGPVGPSGFVRLVALVFWVVLPLLCLLGVVTGITTWTQHAHRQVPGIPGTFLVENRSCGSSVCLATGTFTSADGNLVIEQLTGQLGWGQNTSHSVVYDTSSPDVIVPLGARWNPTAAITAIFGGALLLAAWGWLVLGVRRPDVTDAFHVHGPALA